MQTSEKEIEICRRFRSSVQMPGSGQKVGIALSTLALKPLNALRHQPEGETCGWYIWGGEKLSQDPDFFQSMHVSHLPKYCLQLLPTSLLPPASEYYWHRVKKMFGMMHRYLIPKSHSNLSRLTFYLSRPMKL